jgi:photosystem II stability/assembly factor-like uncharacterized protein
MRMLSRISMVVPMVLALACTEDDSGPNPDPNPDPNPGAWLVGDAGTMFAITVDGEASTYPLEHDEDLRAIACLGESTAWVVGTSGTVLRSRDAGQHWDAVTIEGTTSIDWTALAVAEASIEPLEVLWVVGEGGAIAHTADGGSSWTLVEGAMVDFTGVATTIDGSDAIAVADDGSIWQIDSSGATAVHHADVPLHSVGLSVHGQIATAVGAEGRMLASDDGGATWLDVSLPTTRDLHAVRVSHDGQLSLAVGEAGVVVRVEPDNVEVSEWTGPEIALYGLHLRHDGLGQAVGDAGTVLSTEDGGRTWTSATLPTMATLRGVDDFHVGGHY